MQLQQTVSGSCSCSEQRAIAAQAVVLCMSEEEELKLKGGLTVMTYKLNELIIY
ncbi:hypothetical protein ACFPYJ_01985 [Paenibacillus solisilvae]|uniref:Bacteriocin n=1 Tax=Paenibacillus solisilvae TaxID=2486751 RepID=A0ABW0VT03_9BACL